DVGWSNASSPGFSGAAACWSDGSSTLKTSSASFSSLACSSSSGNFEIGSSRLALHRSPGGEVKRSILRRVGGWQAIGEFGAGIVRQPKKYPDRGGGN